MPRSVSQSGAPVVAPQINNRPNLKGIFGKLSIHDVRNVAQSAIPCRLAYTPGVHERTANSSAISVAYDVMEAGRSGLSRSDAKALDKAMWQFSPQSPIRLGGKLQCYMTVLGAERASVALLLRESACDERLSRCLSRCLDQLDRAIVKVAVRIGKCDGVPDGAFHGDPKSKKLFDEIEVAKGVMTRCVREVGGGEVMRGIAEAILPSAMRHSVAERLPDSFAKFDRADGAPDILNVLQVDEALSLQRVIGNMLEDGSPEALAEAVLHLLKAPEYVEQSQPGGKPDKPDKPPRTPRRPTRRRRCSRTPVAVQRPCTTMLPSISTTRSILTSPSCSNFWTSRRFSGPTSAILLRKCGRMPTPWAGPKNAT